MSQVTLEEAAARLPELIEEVIQGQEVILTLNSVPVAKLVPVRKPRPRAGSAKGFIHHMADDFDAIPEGFEEYMP
jgi:prevent-host-death family protein